CRPELDARRMVRLVERFVRGCDHEPGAGDAPVGRGCAQERPGEHPVVGMTVLYLEAETAIEGDRPMDVRDVRVRRQGMDRHATILSESGDPAAEDEEARPGYASAMRRYHVTT